MTDSSTFGFMAGDLIHKAELIAQIGYEFLISNPEKGKKLSWFVL